MKKVSENQRSRITNKSRNEWLKLALEGNRNAINKVMADKMGMIDELANQFALKNNRFTLNDFRSAGYDGLMNSLQKFKLKEISDFSAFSSYAYRCAKNSMLHLVKGTQTNIKYIEEIVEKGKDYDALSKILFDNSLTSYNNFLMDTEKDEIISSVKYIQSLLPKRTQEILTMRYTDDRGLKEIANYYGTSCQNIDKIIRKSLAFIRANLDYDLCA